MTYQVLLRDNETGVTRTVVMNEEWAGDFLWTEGNFACELQPRPTVRRVSGRAGPEREVRRQPVLRQLRGPAERRLRQAGRGGAGMTNMQMEIVALFERMQQAIDSNPSMYGVPGKRSIYVTDLRFLLALARDKQSYAKADAGFVGTLECRP